MTTLAACAHCAAVPMADDRFCEVCGAPLQGDRVALVIDGAAAVSDRGHVRVRNEDAVALGRERADGPVAVVVCDGVSSTRSSHLAARAAADAALGVLLSSDVRDAVAAAAAAAAALVPSGTPHPPSCTLVCARHDPADGLVTVGWVGDSRAYWLAQPGSAEPSRLLTADHTAEAAAAAGTLDPVVAAARPDAITRWLGADGEAEPDLAGFTPAGPGALLLCTDGLWKYLPDAAGLAALALPALRDGPPAAVDALVAAALAAGGADNVTVAVLPVPQPLEKS
jgi:serine/threonine protein phosphatase PrpC